MERALACYAIEARHMAGLGESPIVRGWETRPMVKGAGPGGEIC